MTHGLETCKRDVHKAGIESKTMNVKFKISYSKNAAVKPFIMFTRSIRVSHIKKY